MELRHLRYFVAVAEHGSTTRAAQHLLVAQPSLSRQLRRLETDVGITLFDHGRGRLRLTPAGQRFLPIARDLIARAGAARDAAAAISGGQAWRIAIAAPVTTIADVIAPYIATTSADDSMITVREVLPAEAYQALWQGSDLAISSATPPADLAGVSLARLPLLGYVPAGHSWAGRDGIDLAELAGEPLILLTDEHGTRRLFDDAAGAAGIRFRAAFETSIPQIAQALAAAGHGVAVVSDDPRYDLHPLLIRDGDHPLRITLYAAWDPSHYAAHAIAPLVAELRRFCVQRYGPAAAFSS